MEYYDNNTSKNRKFLTWEVKDEGSTIQGPALYEVVMVMKRFAVLSRKFGVIPNTQKGGMNVNNSKIEYDKIEKIFLADEDTPAELVWLGPSLKNETRMAVSPVKPFFTGDVLKKYTALHWREVKSFVSKNRLDLKRKTDLVKTLTYYHQLESADD